MDPVLIFVDSFVVLSAYYDKLNEYLTLILANTDFLGVALDDTRLLVNKVVCGDNEYNFFSLASFIVIIVDTPLLIHPLLLQLLRSKLSQLIMWLPIEALDKHQTYVGLASTRLDEDDRPKILMRKHFLVGLIIL